MNLPWQFARKRENPWDDTLDLSAWVTLPAGSPYQLMGMIASISRVQCDLSDRMVRMARQLALTALVWCALAALNIFWMARALQWF